MATLQDIIDQIQAEVRTVPGIRAAPDEPPAQISHFPFAVCYAREGHYRIGPPNTMQGIHEIVLEVHVARQEMERDFQEVMPYAKAVPAAILAAYKSGRLSGLEVLKEIGYAFGPLGWGGVATMGFLFRISGIKTQDAIE